MSIDFCLENAYINNLERGKRHLTNNPGDERAINHYHKDALDLYHLQKDRGVDLDKNQGITYFLWLHDRQNER